MESREAATSKANKKPTVNDSGDELVTVELFYDGVKYKDPVDVGVNGVFIKVPRGKPVQIKRKYAEVLEHSMAMDREAGKRREAMASEFESQSKALNVDI